MSAERVEDRTLLSVTSFFEAAEGELHISSNAGDAIAVGAAGGLVTVNGQSTGVAAAAVRELDLNGGPQGNMIDVSGVTRADFPILYEIDIDAYGGDDSVTGSEFDDHINGGVGHDDIDGGDGDDFVFGASGHDTLHGSDGDDILNGGVGNDDLDGGIGDDRVVGRSGDDVLRGGDGNDSLRGSSGSDHLDGGEGTDRLRGNTGSDSLTGGMGDDLLVGGRGDDALMESGDKDFTLTNTALTGMGSDSLRGVEAAQLSGGAGNNTIDASAFTGKTTLAGGAGADSILGGIGDDSIEGQDGDDTISGGSGADDIDGGLGNDDLAGGDDDDIIRGGHGADLLHGDDGDDDLDGEDDDDILRGGQGDDFLRGGLGINLLDGDDGFDEEYDGFSGDLDEELLAALANASGTVIGRVEFEQSPEHGDTEVELEILITNATPGVHDIVLGGVVIGQLRVSANGVGAVEYSNQPDDHDEFLLPANVPAVTGGTTISVGTIASGTFQGRSQLPSVPLTGSGTGSTAANTGTTGTGGTGTTTDTGTGTTGGGGFTFAPDSEMELGGLLTGTTAAHGEVEFEREFDDGRLEREFEVEVANAPPDALLDVRINGVLVGQIQTDFRGRGEVEFESHPDDSDELPLPVDFVDPQPGDVVTVGTIMSATLFSELELKGRLAGTTAARGEVEFEREFEHGRLEREFEVEIENAPANSLLDVRINGVLVGQIQTDFRGRGELEFSSYPDGFDEQLLPAGFVDPQVGDVVTIDSIMSGTLVFDD